MRRRGWKKEGTKKEGKASEEPFAQKPSCDAGGDRSCTGWKDKEETRQAKAAERKRGTSNLLVLLSIAFCFFCAVCDPLGSAAGFTVEQEHTVHEQFPVQGYVNTHSSYKNHMHANIGYWRERVGTGRGIEAPNSEPLKRKRRVIGGEGNLDPGLRIWESLVAKDKQSRAAKDDREDLTSYWRKWRFRKQMEKSICKAILKSKRLEVFWNNRKQSKNGFKNDGHNRFLFPQKHKSGKKRPKHQILVKMESQTKGNISGTKEKSF